MDIRLIAASNRDLSQAVAERTFRSDLYYRLRVFPIVIPPLRDRGEDIELLARHFIARFAREMKREIPGLTAAALRLLERHSWPGNVRELKNAIERAMIMNDGHELDLRHFELGHSPETDPPPADVHAKGWPPLKDASRMAAEETEARLIRDALQATGGNKSQAADLLKISYKTLWAKSKEYDL